MFCRKTTFWTFGTALIAAIVLTVASGNSLRADFTFGEPVHLDPVIPYEINGYIDSFSPDGLEMTIGSWRPGGYGDNDVWVLRRATVNESWGPPENLGPMINSPSLDATSCISPDGLELYFNSDRPGGFGSYDLYMAKRATRDSPWGQAVNVGPTVNQSYIEAFPWVTSAGLELYFQSQRPNGNGGFDLYVSRRPTVNDPWNAPVNLGPAVNSPYNDTAPSLSPDGLLLVFQDFGMLRPGGYGNGDLWMARRASVSDPWGAPVNLGPKVNGVTFDHRPCVCPDGLFLYFARESNGTITHWQTPITPIVDFNGDGNIDTTDMISLIDNWGTDNTLYDIGPFAWGDGIVGAQDLAVLGEYMDVRGPVVVHSPGANATEVPCDVVLSWTPGDFAQTHDVYFGTASEAVMNADRNAHPNVLVTQGQDPNTYDPPGLLEFGQTYYWRIDEVGVAPDFAIYRGPVLSFTTEAYAYLIQNIIATASSSQAGTSPQSTVNGSGLDKNDGHSTTNTDMWQSTATPGPHWIQYEFDQVYSLHELWVWNSNQAIEPFIGFGARTVKTEYSSDGTTWMMLEGVPEFARASGKPGYVADTKISFGGVQARYVKLTIEANWGGLSPSTGLSEVRFFHIPDRSSPKP
jgi:hypothetical protein